jgi:hypothetical protein
MDFDVATNFIEKNVLLEKPVVTQIVKKFPHFCKAGLNNNVHKM